MKTFNSENIEILNKYLPVVIRVHSDIHPELNEVLSLYQEMMQDDKSLEEKQELSKKLAKVTNNFTIPADACETYAKSYQLLADLNKELNTPT